MARALKNFFAVLAAFAAAGLAGYPLKAGFRARAPEAASVRAAVGSGGLFAVLGGYRSLVADFVWIKCYINWEKKDISKCVSAMELACGLDPQMAMFWTQGASILAFDIPHWLFGRLPQKLRTDEKFESLKRRQARAAVEFIDKGIRMYPDSYELLVQKGQIAISAKNFKLAEECFGRAAKLNDGFYARRIYAGLLSKNGKFAEAAKVLRAVLDEAEPDNPARAAIENQLRAAQELAAKTAPAANRRP